LLAGKPSTQRSSNPGSKADKVCWVSGEIQKLWRLIEFEQFRAQREGLDQLEANQLRRTLLALRKCPELPAPMDFDHIAPFGRVYWRRHVDGTDLWVFFDISEECIVNLLAVRPLDDW